MDENFLVDFTRLEQQLFEEIKPNEEGKKVMRKRLHEQLVEKQAVVKVQPIDVEYQKLIKSLRQRLLFLQKVVSPQKRHKSKDEEPKIELKNEYFALDLSSDSSDDEILANIIKTKSVKASKEAEEEEFEYVTTENKVYSKINENLKDNQMKNENKRELESKKERTVEYDVPLALRKAPRERKASYKSYASSSSSLKNVSTNSHTVSKKQKHIKSGHNRRDSVVSTSGTVYHHDEDLFVEEDYEIPHTFHIKIPSLFKRSVHNLHLDCSEFSRKVIEYRTKLSKQKCLQVQQLEESQPDCSKNSKKKISNKNTEKLAQPPCCSKQLQFFQQQQQDEDLSQLIQEVINDAVGNEETLQATTALENINNELNDNYRTFGTLMPHSQSSHEQLSLPQNSTFKEDGTKKRRKSTKNSSNDQQSNEQPVKKRVRKTKAKTYTAPPIDASSVQPPTKSNLAKYVEYFANDCEVLPTGSTTPAASSTMSQPLVTSTTQNFEFVDNRQPHHQQQQQQQTQHQNITYFIDGDWANGGPCQLVQTTGMTIGSGQINQEAMSSPFQDFVNYIDNNADTGNNVIDRVLDNCTSIPISIPLPIANMGLQNILQQRQLQQTTQNISIHQQQQQPIINIQIPSLPSIPNNKGHPGPPPQAHSRDEVLDLSVKSNFSIISSQVLNLNKNTNLSFETLLSINEEDNCLPLDLSVKSSQFNPNSTTSTTSFSHEKLPRSQFSIANNQEDDFIRCLIETSDFDLRPEELIKSTAATYDDGESFKAALDMPILELNDADLVKLVENTTNIGESDESNKLNDNNVSKDSTKFISNNDSNYASMSESNVIAFGDEINFADQSTKEIFDKLLDIGPDNNMSSLEPVVKDNNCTFVELDETTFDRNNVQNSTMCEVENVSNQKDQQDCDIMEQNKINSSNTINENVSASIDNKTEMDDKFIPQILKRRKRFFQINPTNEDKSNVTDAKLKKGDVKTKENPTEIEHPETNKISDKKIKDDSTKDKTNNTHNNIKENIVSVENTVSLIEIDPIEVVDNTNINKKIEDAQLDKSKVTETRITPSRSLKDKPKNIELDQHNSVGDLELKTSISNQQDKFISAKDIIIEINTTKVIDTNKINYHTDGTSKQNEMVVENKRSTNEINPTEIVEKSNINSINESEQKVKPKESKEEIKPDQSLKKSTAKIEPHQRFKKSQENYVAKPTSEIKEIVVENETSTKSSLIINHVENKKINKISESEQKDKPKESKDEIETHQSLKEEADKIEQDLRFEKNKESKENEMIVENEASTKEVHSINDVKNKKTNEIKESEQNEKPKETKQEIETHQSLRENSDKIEPDKHILIGDKETTNTVLEQQDYVSAENISKESAGVLQNLKISTKSDECSQNESNAESSLNLPVKLQKCTSAKEDNLSLNVIKSKESTDLMDKQHDSAEFVDDNNDSIESEESLHLKVSDTSENSNEINLSEKSIKSDEFLNLKIDLTENTNDLIDLTATPENSNKSKEIKSDESLNLKIIEIDLTENTNEIIDLTVTPENSNKSNEINFSEKCVKSEESLSLKITEIDLTENTNEAISLSVNLKIPENNTTTDTSTNLNNPLSNKQDSTETELNKLDNLVDLIDLFEESDASLYLKRSENDTLQKPNKSTNNSAEKSIDSDKSLNLKMSENDSLQSSAGSDLSLNLKIAESCSSDKCNKTNSPGQSIEYLEISLSNNDPTINETTKTIGAEFSSNKNIVFSVAKIALSDDGILFTDIDTNSLKSLNAAIFTNNQDIEKKDTEETEMENNSNYAILTYRATNSNKSFDTDILTHHLDIETNDNTENMSSDMEKSAKQRDDTVVGNENVQIQNNEENVDICMPKLTILENYTNSTYEVEQNDKPLCLTKSIQKKYYLDFSQNDIIDLSTSVISRDTDRDDLLIDESIHPSPMLGNSCYSDNSETSNYIFPENSTVLKICDHQLQDVTDAKDCVNSKILEHTTEENNQVPNSCSLKSNDLTNLTPLELESKLEDALDFEDFDDALSLATSCFDSPNEDRFEESMVDETESETKVTTTNLVKSENETTNISANINKPSQTTSSASSPTIGLKSFKIPRLNKVSITPAAVADKPTDFLTNLPSVPKTTIKQPIVKLEKITRTVKNELAAAGSVLINMVQQQEKVKPNSQPSSFDKQQIKFNFTNKSEIASATNPQNTRGVCAGLNGEALHLADKIVQIFGVTCLPHLVNQCYDITHCPLSHQINNQDIVFQALSTLNKAELNESYKFMYNHSNLFQIYSIVFCNYYVLQKDRTKLLNMVNDCERYPEYSEFLFSLYEGLVKCGFSRVNACRQILKRSRERITPIINVLVAIIMKSDWTMFTDFIEHITDEKFKYKFRIGILEQMAPAVLSSKGPQLKQLFGKCVQMLHCEDTVLLCNSPSLIQCVALLTNT